MKKRELQRFRLDPKVRMILNGGEVVNVMRAERSPYVAVVQRSLLEALPQQRGLMAQSSFKDELPKSAKRGHLGRPPKTVFTNVFVQLRRSTSDLPDVLAGRSRYVPPPVRRGNQVTAAVPSDRMMDLLGDPAVVAIEAAEQIRFYPPVEVKSPAEVSSTASETGLPAAYSDGGEAVLIGIVDVQGFDFAHEEFLDEHHRTRFVRIWDQGGNTRESPALFGYGSELTGDHMNAAINAAPQQGLPATDLEPQSQMVPSSHGTHVASIAAGKTRGLCPKAVIAGVLVSLPMEDMDRRRSFYDSTRLAHTVDYLFGVGEELGLPVSINISLGTNGHAHDASSATSRWIDHALTTAGRSICVAAGNAGQEAPADPNDWGFVMGRIHTSGKLTEEDPSADIEWVVAGDGIADLSENELEIWYSPRDRFELRIKPPDGEWSEPIKPGEFIENEQLAGGTFLSVYNELYSPANGHSYIACYLSPFFSEKGTVGVRAGTWIVRLSALEIRDGEYHAWIERDDPRRLSGTGLVDAWAFPSFFSRKSNVDNSSVSSLACGPRIVSVANFDASKGGIHITSSQGPTRDGRKKPDTSAPGTDIIAANGFDPDEKLVAMTGTSMASPYVAGVAGLMLSAEPRLTAAQIVGIVRRTSSPLKTGDYRWRNDSGFGLIDPAGCLAEVERLKSRKDLNP